MPIIVLTMSFCIESIFYGCANWKDIEKLKTAFSYNNEQMQAISGFWSFKFNVGLPLLTICNFHDTAYIKKEILSQYRESFHFKTVRFVLISIRPKLYAITAYFLLQKKIKRKKIRYPFLKLKCELMALVIRSVNTSAFSALGPKNHVPTAAQGFASSSLRARLEKMWRLWSYMRAFPLRGCFFPFRLLFLRGVNIVACDQELNDLKSKLENILLESAPRRSSCFTLDYKYACNWAITTTS